MKIVFLLACEGVKRSVSKRFSAIDKGDDSGAIWVDAAWERLRSGRYLWLAGKYTREVKGSGIFTFSDCERLFGGS